MIDPVTLSSQIYKSGLIIKDIVKNSQNSWHFDIDSFYAKISCTKVVDSGEELKIDKPLKDIFIKVLNSNEVIIKSDRKDSWYPYIVLYTRDLQIIDIKKLDKIHKDLIIELPNNTSYIKISDLYTLSNIKRGLTISTKLENIEE
jgi:hypothetical protein